MPAVVKGVSALVVCVLVSRTAFAGADDPGRQADRATPAVSTTGERVFKGTLDPIGPFELRDLDGKTRSDRDFLGKVLIVVQWAAWCAPCIAEFPEVQKLHDSLRGDSTVALVSFDMDEKPAAISDFLSEFRKEYSFPVLFAWSRFRIRALPYTWIVDREGYIREAFQGAGPGWSEQVRALAEAVKRRPPVASFPADVRKARREQSMRDAASSR